MTFSVIVPLYNVEQYARECIESVLNQTYADFELILVDDGSTDTTGDIIDEYQLKDNRIRTIHKVNGGLTSARKAGAQIAKGEYAVIIDGDDWIDKDYLMEFYNIIAAENPDVICTEAKKVYPDGSYTLIKTGMPISGLLDRAQIEQAIIARLFDISPTVWSKAYKMELYRQSQMSLDDTICMGEDGCIVYPLLVRAQRIFALSGQKYNYRYVPTSITNSSKKFVPWSSLETRIRHFEAQLPIGEYDLFNQLKRYVTHGCNTVISTQINKGKYRIVSHDVRAHLSDGDIAKFFKGKLNYGTRKEKILYIILKYKLFGLHRTLLLFENRK